MKKGYFREYSIVRMNEKEGPHTITATRQILYPDSLNTASAVSLKFLTFLVARMIGSLLIGKVCIIL
jgi:hypothetical protein